MSFGGAPVEVETEEEANKLILKNEDSANVMQIVMKSCCETHYHFCFNEVLADVVFCSSCTKPIYWSQHCQEQAGASRGGISNGQEVGRTPSLHDEFEKNEFTTEELAYAYYNA